jgi:hypothetical protein
MPIRWIIETKRFGSGGRSFWNGCPKVLLRFRSTGRSSEAPTRSYVHK